jgi:hypothetical protein
MTIETAVHGTEYSGYSDILGSIYLKLTGHILTSVNEKD